MSQRVYVFCFYCENSLDDLYIFIILINILLCSIVYLYKYLHRCIRAFPVTSMKINLHLNGGLLIGSFPGSLLPPVLRIEPGDKARLLHSKWGPLCLKNPCDWVAGLVYIIVCNDIKRIIMLMLINVIMILFSPYMFVKSA